MFSMLFIVEIRIKNNKNNNNILIKSNVLSYFCVGIELDADSNRNIIPVELTANSNPDVV